MRAKAILLENSAFVSASAGTGKTKTLIDRLVYLLLSNVKPSKILCLAFTRAAAAEILTRINQRLAMFAICSEEEINKELINLGFTQVSSALEYKARILFAESLDAIEPLNIQTIHAFSQQLLLKFPFEAGINLNSTLLTENKVSLFINQAKDMLIQNIHKYPKAKEAISYLSWHIKEYSLKELLTEIITNREKLDHFFNLHGDLDSAINSIAPNMIDENGVIHEFIDNIPLNYHHLEVLYNGGKNDINRAEKLKKFLQHPKDLQNMLITDYLYCFLTAVGEPVKVILGKKISDNNLELAMLFEQEQQRVYKFSQFFKQLKAIYLTKAFVSLSYYIRQIYMELKQQNNSLDYNDLIILSTALLNNNEHAEWIRYKLDGGIEHILVDEAQDTSANQWQIINRISEDFLNHNAKSLFIVGDAKQSIFSFQGAKPELFNAMNKNLSEEVLRVQLSQSFRSGEKILQLVDMIFNQPHIKPLVTGIEKIIHHQVYKTSESVVELWPLIIDPEVEETKPWALPSDFMHNDLQTGNQQLAKKIAEQIKLDLESNKIVNPGDILILTRRRTDFITNLIQELRKLEIPTAGLDRFKLLNHPIVMDIIALTNFLLCEADDLNLAITLKSPICKLSEEQLLDLCHNRDVSLWERVKAVHPDIAIFLTELRLLAKHQSPFEFYFNLIEYRNLRAWFIDEFNLEAHDILDSFLDLVTEYESENISSLQLFIHFLSTVKTEVKRDLSQSNNQVRIMTIHGAKGLQAKIVILTDTTSLPTNNDTIIWLNEAQLLWPGKEKYYPDIAKEAKIRKQESEYAEYLRLLYVALTRAEDRLIICGVAKDERISDKSWYAIVQSALN